MKKTVAVFLFSSLIWGCGSSETHFNDGILRTPDEAPLGFRAPQSEDHCKNPLVDEAEGTELILIRSTQGLGDYQVSEGIYGLNADELLRIDCSTGEVLGVVRR